MWSNWPKETSETEGRDLQMHQNIVETWDDSDSITVVNAQKDLRHPAKWWRNHLTSQYHGSEINCRHTEVVGTELGLESTDLISLRISNT